MKQTVVGNRYAIALFEIAEKYGQTEKIEQDLQTVKQVFLQVKEMGRFLQTPNIPADVKKNTVKQVFPDLSQYALNTLFLLIDKRQIGNLLPMIEKYHELRNEKRGIAEAKVFSARPLTGEEAKAVSEFFAKKLRKNELTIENIVDTDLLGGIKVQVGNRIFDGSLKGKLDRLKRELIGQ